MNSNGLPLGPRPHNRGTAMVVPKSAQATHAMARYQACARAVTAPGACAVAWAVGTCLWLLGSLVVRVASESVGLPTSQEEGSDDSLERAVIGEEANTARRGGAQ
jgi:hypothetical protein